MNKLIDKLIEKDIVVQIISVLFAILIWFTVLDSDNPFTDKTISVPLQADVSVLMDKNLEIVSSSIPSNVDVTIRGRKQRVEKVTSNDFEVFLDLSQIDSSDKASLAIDDLEYKGTQDVLVTEINPGKIDLYLENIVRKEFPVEVEYIGELPEGYSLVNKLVKPETIVLEERESLISKVDTAKVTVDFTQLTDTHDIYKRIEFTDKNGNTISGLDNTNQALVSFDYAKQVPITAHVIGTPEPEFYYKAINIIPDSVLITGPLETLNGINNIQAESIDITGRDSDYTEPLTLALPENTALLQQIEINANMNLEPYLYQYVTIPKNNIVFTGILPENNFEYDTDTPLKIQIKGREEDFNILITSSIKCYVNIKDIEEEGEYNISVVIQSPDGISVIGEYNVLVSAKKAEPVVEPTPEPTTIPVPGITPSPGITPGPSVTPTPMSKPTPTPINNSAINPKSTPASLPVQSDDIEDGP